MAGSAKRDLKNTAEIADIFGYDERRVQQLAKDGTIPTVSVHPYKFELIPTVKAYIRHLRERIDGKETKNEAAGKAEEDKLRAEADLKQSKAKIEKMKLRELEGKMHRSEDVEAMTNNLVYAVRSMIMALPGRLAMDVVEVESAAEASVLIRTECYKILNELASYQYDAEAYQKAVREREGWSEILTDEDDQ